MNEDQIEQLKTALTYHQEKAQFIKRKLKEIDPTRGSGYKSTYLKVMKSCTQPFANYNKNVNKYLDNPALADFNKIMNKVNRFNDKLALIDTETLKISKINKLLNITNKLESQIQKYSKNLNDYIPQVPESRDNLITLSENKKVLIQLKTEIETKLGDNDMESKELNKILDEINHVPQDEEHKCWEQQQS